MLQVMIKKSLTDHYTLLLPFSDITCPSLFFLFLVDNEIVGSIQKGVCVLLGIATDDTEKDVDYMVNKILNIRVFDDNGVMWKKGVKDAGLELLCGKFQNLRNQVLFLAYTSTKSLSLLFRAQQQKATNLIFIVL